jgi:DNA-binding XRE family transcriptional regulator
MKDRIIKIMDAVRMNTTQFADTIGVQTATIQHIRSGRNNPSLDVVNRILNRFRWVNPYWLHFGEGEMRINDKNITDSSRNTAPSTSPLATTDRLFFSHEAGGAIHNAENAAASSATTIVEAQAAATQLQEEPYTPPPPASLQKDDSSSTSSTERITTSKQRRRQTSSPSQQRTLHNTSNKEKNELHYDRDSSDIHRPLDDNNKSTNEDINVLPRRINSIIILYSDNTYKIQM